MPLLFSSLLLAAIGSGCSTTPPAANTTAVVSATPAEQNPGIELEIVTQQPLEGSITATGKIVATDDGTASIGPVHEGRIKTLYAGQGSFVTKGQRLADLESADIDQAEADYLKALADSENARRTSAAEIKFAQATYDRTKLLFDKEITAGKNLQQAEHDLELAKANAANAIASNKVSLLNARRHLLILGIKDSAINALATNPNGASSVFTLNAPISGMVVERNGTVGATVGTDANLFKIIDLSSVWIDANVFEKDLERVQQGQAVKVTVPAFPESTFYGRVIFITSLVDPDTRTVKVRTVVPNRDGRLKPDMFASVQLITASHESALTLPLAAVLDDNGKSVIFVAEGNEYKRREVTLGLKSDDRVEITSGIAAGDKVVVKGNYLLMEQSKADQ